MVLASAIGSSAGLTAQAPQADRQSSGHALLVGLSLAHVQARDELLTGLRWQGPGLELELGWEMAGARDDHRLTLTVPFALVENRYGHRGFLLGAGLEYAYARATPWSPAGRAGIRSTRTGSPPTLWPPRPRGRALPARAWGRSR
jgi:hypothetical protein